MMIKIPFYAYLLALGLQLQYPLIPCDNINHGMRKYQFFLLRFKFYAQHIANKNLMKRSKIKILPEFWKLYGVFNIQLQGGAEMEALSGRYANMECNSLVIPDVRTIVDFEVQPDWAADNWANQTIRRYINPMNPGLCYSAMPRVETWYRFENIGQWW